MSEIKEVFYFSVIIPAFNRSEDLNRALLSLKKQTFKSFEVIVLDDNSSVDLSEVVNNYKKEFSIKYFKFNVNKGAAYARNYGVRNSEAKYIAYLDSDDEFCKDKLEIFHRVIESDGRAADTLYFSSCYVNRGGDKLLIRPSVSYDGKSDIMEYIFCSWGLVSTITMVMSKKIALSCPFNENLRRHQDYDLCFTIQSKGYKFKMIDMPLSVWNDVQDPNRITRSTGYDAAIVWFNIVENNLTEQARRAYLSRVLAPMIRPKYKGIILLCKNFFKVKTFNFSDFFVFIIKILLPNFYKKLSDFYVDIKGRLL